MNAITSAYHRSRERKVPKGWITVRQYSDAEAISYPGSQKRLNEMWRKGLVKRELHPNPTGFGSPCYIYRLK